MQDTELYGLADQALASLVSINELLRVVSDVASKSAAPEALGGPQKRALLDSVVVKRFHLKYKQWENNSKEHYIRSQIVPYNKKVAEISRVYAQYETSHAQLTELSRAVKLPELDLSLETVQTYENGRLLENVGESGRKLAKIALSSLFSLATDSPLPAPTLEVIADLINIEYRLRMQCQIENEVLLRLKLHLIAKNSQWSARDTKLNLFLTRDVKKVYEEVAAIKASEYEDLKYYEEEIDLSEEEDLQDEEEEKEEEELIEEEKQDMEEKDIEEKDMEEKDMEEKDIEEKDTEEKGDLEEKGDMEEKDFEEETEPVSADLDLSTKEDKMDVEAPADSGFKDPDNNDDMLLE